jgi:hypothetical protein
MTVRSFFIYMLGLAGLICLASQVSMPLVAYSTVLPAYPNVATAVKQTQVLTASHGVTAWFQSPMSQLKHANLKQLEQKAGPLFGRFYQERILINNPIPVQPTVNPKPLSLSLPGGPLLVATSTNIPAYPAPEADSALTPVVPVLDTRSVADTTQVKVVVIKPSSTGPLGWLKRLTQLDAPVDDLQLFIP